MGLLTLEQLAEANRTRLESGGTVAEIVVANGWVTPEQLAVLTGDAAVAAPAPAPAPAPAVEPEPEPVVELSAPVPPPAAPAPEIAPPLRMAEVEQPAPLAPVEPIAAAPAAPAPAPVAGMFCVAVRLQGGERVDVLAGVDEQTAQHRAREIVSELARARPDEWPHYAGRFLRPDAILSVDVLQDE
jgi:hypothetical protein